MVETMLDSISDPVPHTPEIREVRFDSGPENYNAVEPVCFGSGTCEPGIRRVGLRAVIDTSPPFGSVKEAVTRFEGSGYYKLGEHPNCDEEFDIKRVEEQAAELEKDLIVKELQTLDILEELNTNKKIVEDLKRQLQQEVSKCSDSLFVDADHIKQMNDETSQRPASSSPEKILMELKQAKMNLGKTINDLGGIQTSVESLNKRTMKEKLLIEKTCKRLSLEEQLKHARIKSPILPNHVAGIQNPANFLKQLNCNARQFRKMGDAARAQVSRSSLGNENGKIDIKTAEIRLVAAIKMQEAARASEALAIAEIEALSDNRSSSRKKFVHELGEVNISKLAMFRKLEEATEEILHGKRALEEALSRVEIVNQKQIAVEEALRKWIPINDHNFQPMYNPGHSPFNFIDKPSILSDEPKPIPKQTVSMRDFLRRKPVSTDGFVGRDENKVALSQMLDELKSDLTFHPKIDQKEGGNDHHRKPLFTHRRKFGFVHISLPLTKQSKKKMQQEQF